MSRILAVAHDPGGANAVAAVTSMLRGRGADVVAIAKGPAQNQFRRLGVDFTGFESGAIGAMLSGGVALVLTGTSMKDSFERDAVQAAHSEGVPSIALVDYWQNHQERFALPGGLDSAIADYVIAIDERCRRQMIADGVPDERIHVLGQPYFSVLLARGRERTEGAPAVERMLYASEPGPRAARALEVLLRALEQLARPVDVTIRFHPREDERPERLGQISRAGCSFSVDDGHDPLETARGMDAVVGVSSMIVIETSLLGIPTAAFGGGVNELADYGLCVPIEDEADVRAFLRAPRISSPDAAFLAAQRGAADRVAGFCHAVSQGVRVERANTRC